MGMRNRPWAVLWNSNVLLFLNVVTARSHSLLFIYIYTNTSLYTYSIPPSWVGEKGGRFVKGDL